MTDYFWREDSPWLVLQLPDGRRVVAPAAWTDAPTDTFPPTPGHPINQEAITELTPTAFWALLPPTERERLGLRLSQLVLKAVRPPVPTAEEDL